MNRYTSGSKFEHLRFDGTPIATSERIDLLVGLGRTCAGWPSVLLHALVNKERHCHCDSWKSSKRIKGKTCRQPWSLPYAITGTSCEIPPTAIVDPSPVPFKVGTASHSGGGTKTLTRHEFSSILVLKKERVTVNLGSLWIPVVNILKKLWKNHRAIFIGTSSVSMGHFQ